MTSQPISNQSLDVGTTLEQDGVTAELYARAALPTRWGSFDVYVFRSSEDAHEHVAVVAGDVRGVEDVPVRVHSECFTGDVLGSLRCDCREQFDIAMAQFGSERPGILLYMRQEGRGIGLGNKIRAYALQESGMDTVEANHHLGFDDDLRDYRVAAMMIHMLGPTSIQILTNNPRKVFGLRQAGVSITARTGLVVQPNAHNQSYLETKASKSGHLLPLVRRNLDPTG